MRGFANAVGPAVLSRSMYTLLGLLPDAFSARPSAVGIASWAMALDTSEVWNTFLKPRAVIWSE